MFKLFFLRGRKKYNRQFKNNTSKKRYRLKNVTRFTAVLLVLILCVLALSVILGCEFQPVRAVMSAIVPSPSPTPPPPTATPTVTPTPTPLPTPTPPPPGKNITQAIVVVDPGHGGRDPGTTSPYVEGFYEKEVTLDIGFKLKDMLDEAGFHVVMTREEDKELHNFWKEDIWARPRIANEAKANFFVSVHVNAYDGKNWEIYNGTEIYHYGKTHGDYTSKQLAEMMGEEIDGVTDTKYNGVVKADYGVLRLSEMPALLVETAYITNREDHKRLESQQFREDMARGILNGTIRVMEAMGAYKEDGQYKILVDE